MFHRFCLFAALTVATPMVHVHAAESAKSAAHEGTITGGAQDLVSCQVSKFTAKYKIDTLFGDPVVSGAYTWNGDAESIPSDTYLAIRCQEPGGRTYYAHMWPTPGKNGQSSFDTIASGKSWGDFLRTGDSLESSYVSADEAKRFYRAGFSVTGASLVIPSRVRASLSKSIDERKRMEDDRKQRELDRRAAQKKSDEENRQKRLAQQELLRKQQQDAINNLPGGVNIAPPTPVNDKPAEPTTTFGRAKVRPITPTAAERAAAGREALRLYNERQAQQQQRVQALNDSISNGVRSTFQPGQTSSSYQGAGSNDVASALQAHAEEYRESLERTQARIESRAAAAEADARERAAQRDRQAADRRQADASRAASDAVENQKQADAQEEMREKIRLRREARAKLRRESGE